jgi:cytosine/adenosine deaminase-related metal-dependent hydrolase
MPSSSSLLLKDGIVVVHDVRDHATGLKADLLVHGNRIVEIAPNITAAVGVEVIDCQNKIIAPGFVDTHRHMYNTPLRGRYADALVTDYIATGKRDMTP